MKEIEKATRYVKQSQTMPLHKYAFLTRDFQIELLLIDKSEVCY